MLDPEEVPEACALLRQKRDEILAEWERRTRAKMPRVAVLPRTPLRNSLPEYIEELACSLEGAPLGNRAREHGEQRADIEVYGLGELLLEYQILRQVIFDFLEEAGMTTSSLWRLVLDVIEESMSAAAVRYADVVLERERLASEARERLLAVVSHDLRTPLTSMQMSAEIIVRTATDERARRQAMRILSGGERAIALIRDLLDVAAMAAGGFQVKLRRQDPNILLQEAATLFRPLATDRSIALEVSPRTGAREVLADPEQATRILGNLIGNALKFTSPGGWVRVSSREAGDELQVCVEDNGPGIAAEALAHLFDSFWQAASESRREGVGLGLPIVKGLVEAHGGRVWVESEPGKGARFCFTLRMAADEDDEPPNERAI